MSQGRKAEASDVRAWDGVVAEANQLDEVRHWVVWGTGPSAERAAEPERTERPGEPGNDIAWTIARRRDPDWANGDDTSMWVVVLEAEEDVVDEWTLEDESVRGYAPYLMAREDAGSEPGTIRGTLRNDVVKRRKDKRFDAARPD
jgi:hypothetical protein